MKKEISKAFILTITLSITITLILISFITISKNSELNLINNTMINEAKSHFNNILITRSWNSDFGGVYVKSDTLKPNDYLSNNHTFTKDNELLIKINPAWMTRQIAEITKNKNDYFFKMTSLKPINPINLPDEFEEKALRYLDKNQDERFFYEKDEKNNRFNFLGSLVVDSSCMDCHSSQGYKIGDIRGGIRVSIPINSYQTQYDLVSSNSTKYILTIVVLSLIITFLLLRYMISTIKNKDRIEKLNKYLELRVEKELKKSREKDKIYHQQAKLAAMGEMINNIAHQWRQPLSVISSAASGMQIQKEYNQLSDEVFDESTNMILKQSAYMSKTIDDFKNFFKSDNRIKEFEINSLIYDNIELIKSSLSTYNIDFEINRSNEDITIKSYDNELTQVILNILNNAKDQLKKLKPEDEKIIQLFIHKDKKHAIIEIKDNGGGIDESIIDKIFEPYFTTKHRSQGTGIGLYMSQEIITEHLNGEISAHNIKINHNNIEYKGAMFRIKLPLV